MVKKISISIRRVENELVLEYADNGIGLTKNSNKEMGGLGLKIIELLANQLDGSASMENDGGMKCIANFSLIT